MSNPSDSLEQTKEYHEKLDDAIRGIENELHGETGLLDDNEEDNEEPEVHEEDHQQEVDEDVNEEEAEPDPIDDEEPDETQPTYKVKVNGEDVEVTLDELLSGYSRTADYTRKTTEVSEQRRVLEQKQQEVHNQQQQYIAGLTYAMEMLKTANPILAEAEQIDWNKLADENPAEYTRKRAKVEQVANQLQMLDQRRREAEQQQATQFLQQERQRLMEKLPEWKDPKVYDTERKDLQRYLQSIGYRDDEISNLMDHRSVLIARDAMRWKKLQQGKQDLNSKKKVPSAQTKKSITQKPGTREFGKKPGRSNSTQAALSRAKQSHNVDDITNAVMKALMEE